MADNYFINELGISNIITNEVKSTNFYTSHKITFYYRIRRSGLSYTNPDIRIYLKFNDNSSINTGWLKKQGSAGFYSYEGDDGIGYYTITLSKSNLKNIKSITLQARKSTSISGDVDFSKIFTFSSNSGSSFYNYIGFNNKNVQIGTEIKFMGDGISPLPKEMVPKDSCYFFYPIKGEENKIFFGDAIKLKTPKFSYLGLELTPNKTKVSVKIGDSTNYALISEYSTYSAIKELTLQEVSYKTNKVTFKVEYSVGVNESGYYIYEQEMYGVNAIDSYLNVDNLEIHPNYVTKENIDNDNAPFDFYLKIKGDFKSNITDTELPFTIKTITCKFQKENEGEETVLESYEILTSDQEYSSIDFLSESQCNINKPTKIIFTLGVYPLIDGGNETYTYEYDVSKIKQESNIMSIRKITIDIADIYENYSIVNQIPVLLNSETIVFNFASDQIIYNPNDRVWITPESNSDIKFYDDSHSFLENNSFTLQKDITETEQHIFYVEYGELKPFSGSIIVQFGRKSQIKTVDNYIQDGYLYYLLIDNGGDQSRAISSSQYLNMENSLMRNKREQNLQIIFYKDNEQGGQFSITITEDNFKTYFKENTKISIELKNLEIKDDWNGIKFSYNGITPDVPYKLNIKTNRPTLAYRKNGLIINGVKNQQLPDDTFIEINALDVSKKIIINFYSESGSIQKTGKIYYENGSICLEGFSIK